MKLTKEDIIKFLSDNKALLKDHFDVTDIALFGSFARGEETEESDVDLYVEMPADFFKRIRLMEFLEKIFKRKVDILRKHPNLKPRLLSEIEKDSVYV
jgi:hypothetical protein